LEILEFIIGLIDFFYLFIKLAQQFLLLQTIPEDDQDVFMVEILTEGFTMVRVDNLALGMTPFVRVLAADKQTIIDQANYTVSACKDYISIALIGIPRGDSIYVEVTDEHQAAGGLYQFSAGSPLSSDTACWISLPVITR